MLLKRKQRQRLHAGTPSGIYMAEREKYGKGEHTKQNKISTRLLCVCVYVCGGEGGGRLKPVKLRPHDTTLDWREEQWEREWRIATWKGEVSVYPLRSVLHDARKSVKLNLIA